MHAHVHPTHPRTPPQQQQYRNIPERALHRARGANYRVEFLKASVLCPALLFFRGPSVYGGATCTPVPPKSLMNLGFSRRRPRALRGDLRSSGRLYVISRLDAVARGGVAGRFSARDPARVGFNKGILTGRAGVLQSGGLAARRVVVVVVEVLLWTIVVVVMMMMSRVVE